MAARPILSGIPAGRGIDESPAPPTGLTAVISTRPAPAPQYSAYRPQEYTLPIPNSPDRAVVNLLITNNSHSLLVNVMTSREDQRANSTRAALGSFVYAMPDLGTASMSMGPRETVARAQQPLTTAMYVRQHTLDFTTRLARILAARLRKPVFAGEDVDLSCLGRGGDVAEEMELFRKIVESVVWICGQEQHRTSPPDQQTQPLDAAAATATTTASAG